jgi:hypothetical protein
MAKVHEEVDQTLDPFSHGGVARSFLLQFQHIQDLAARR